MNPKDLLNLLDKHDVYIQTHNFPDPDAIASAYGLQQFFAAYNIPSTICYDGKIDRNSTVKMLDTFQIEMLAKCGLKDLTKNDYIVLVDSQKLNANVTALSGKTVACIDHHPTYFPCTYRYMDVRMVGSCSSIIASYFEQTNTPISPSVAAALAYGIKMDTADFTRMVTSFDTEMFSYLFKHADWNMVVSMYKNILEFDDLKAYGAAVQNIKVFQGIGFACIPFECSQALIAIISDFILSLDIIDVAIIYAIQKDGIRFSIRNNKEDVHAGNMITAALKNIGQGGGHAAMAGGMIPAENKPLLGNDISESIQNLFMGYLNAAGY